MSPAEYLRALTPAAKATGLMAVVVVLARFMRVSESALVRLGVQVAAGCFAYSVGLAVVSGKRLRTLVEFLARQSSSTG